MRASVLTPVLASLLCLGALSTPASAASAPPAQPAAAAAPAGQPDAADEHGEQPSRDESGDERDRAAADAAAAKADRAAEAAEAEQQTQAVARAQARVDELRAEVERTTAELTEGTRRLQEGQARLAQVRGEAERVRGAARQAEAEARTAQARLESIVGAAYRMPKADDVDWALATEPGRLLAAARAAEDLEHVQGNQQEALRDAQVKSAAAQELARRAAELQGDAERQAQELTAQVSTLQRQALDTRARLETAAQQLGSAQAAADAEQQARAAAARPSLQVPSLPRFVPPTPTGGGATCQGTSTAGYPNGFLPDTALCPLVVGNGHKLRADAAAAFNRMYAAGAPCITDSYRSYAGQVDLYQRKPNLAAVPGTSNHGWGIAVDFGCGADSFDSPAYAWLKANAGAFGFAHPTWAEPGGSRPEPWHWEYIGS